MKKLNKLILTFFLTVLTSYCQDKFPFDVTVLNCDLKGLITIDQKIILYGNFGNILISEDSGKKWLQNSIGDSIDIANMIVIKEYIVGHSSNYLFESHDRGMNWVNV